MITKELLELSKYNPVLSDLKPGYTFSTFALTDGSMEALDVAMTFAEEKEDMQYPIVIYGNAGLGKTHLLHGAIHYLCEHAKGKKVVLISGRYVRQGGKSYLDATLIQESLEANFLVIDDFEWALESEIQDVFQDLVDAWMKAKKPMLVAMSKHPETIGNLDVTMKDYFLQGTIKEVKYPSEQYCYLILRKELKEKYPEVGLVLREAFVFVVKHSSESITFLRGNFMKVMAEALLTGTRIVDLGFAEKVLHGTNHNAV